MAKQTKRQIKDAIKQLRSAIDDPETSEVIKQVAYESECVLRWAIEDTDGWPSPLESAAETAAMIAADVSAASD